MGEKLTDFDLAVLRKVPDRDAFWTSDIAYDARIRTSEARSSLKRLEKAGFVQVVSPGGQGYPASWRRTEAGRAALSSERHHG